MNWERVTCSSLGKKQDGLEVTACPLLQPFGGGCNSQVASETCHGESLDRLAAGMFTNMKKQKTTATNKQTEKKKKHADNMLNSTSNKCGFRPTKLKDFTLACSQTLCFVFENRRACVYENVQRGGARSALAVARLLRLRAHQIVNRLWKG